MPMMAYNRKDLARAVNEALPNFAKPMYLGSGERSFRAGLKKINQSQRTSSYDSGIYCRLHDTRLIQATNSVGPRHAKPSAMSTGPTSSRSNGLCGYQGTSLRG